MSTPEFGLPTTTVDTIRKILAEVPAVKQAVIYGSRAKGTQRPGSDIDLTLFGDDVDLDILGQISTHLEESSIPYHVDLSVFRLIEHPDLREHIERVGQVFYEALKAEEVEDHADGLRKQIP